MTTWFDRSRALRDALLTSPRFQRWATALPLTRPIARRRARALFDICAGFVYSQVLLACVRLEVFSLLAEGPKPLAELAARMDLPEAAARRLLDAAASLRLTERRGKDRYGLGDLGAALLGNSGILEMVEHHALLYADLEDPVALLRSEAGGAAGRDGKGTRLAAYWAYAREDRPSDLKGERIADYTRLMGASQPMVAQQVLATYRLGRHRRLLDVGGGDGSFLAAVAAEVPKLELMLFDLPPVAERAAARFAAEGLSDRASVQGGDFLQDPLPQGADIISLVRIVHDHDDAAVLTLLRAVRRALPPDGRLLIAEPMAATPGAEPVGEAYFGFYLLAMGSGRARSPAELEGLLRASGFEKPKFLRSPAPLVASVMIARPAPDPAGNVHNA